MLALLLWRLPLDVLKRLTASRRGALRQAGPLSVAYMCSTPDGITARGDPSSCGCHWMCSKPDGITARGVVAVTARMFPSELCSTPDGITARGAATGSS